MKQNLQVNPLFHVPPFLAKDKINFPSRFPDIQSFLQSGHALARDPHWRMANATSSRHQNLNLYTWQDVGELPMLNTRGGFVVRVPSPANLIIVF